MSKKLLNSVDSCVDECLKGLARANPNLVHHAKQRVIFDGSDGGKRKVAVISGGGAGHEPFSTGYVGRGMLTAAISGSVFASPPSSHVLHAIRQSAKVSPGGVFVLIPNYTGDILNFGLAVELAKGEGIQVDSLVVGEDIAQEAHGVVSRAGRRGMCGLVVLFKIAGSAAAAGATLEQVKEAATLALSNLASIGLGLSGCTLPGATSPLFELADDEMELGVGVHGEAGVQRLKILTVKHVVDIFLKDIVGYFGLQKGDQVAVFVNNLGGLSQLEQWVVAGEVSTQLEEKDISLMRLYAAPIFTSINMAGVQVCCLRLPPSCQSSWLAALDEDTLGPAWPGGRYSLPTTRLNFPQCDDQPEPHIVQKGPKASPAESRLIQACLKSATTALINSETRLNILDSGCGDGDCGTTLRHLATGISEALNGSKLNLQYPATLGAELAAIAATTMGGTSGAIYSLLLTHAGTALEEVCDLGDPATWAQVLRAGINGVQKYSVARVGDRTMFDSLEPACDAFSNGINGGLGARESLKRAVEAGKHGCEQTKTMKAMAGRASYVDASHLREVDAGAFAVTVWLDALRQAITQSSDC